MSETRSELPCSCSCSRCREPGPPPPPLPPPPRIFYPYKEPPLPPPPRIFYPYNEPVRRSSAVASIQMVPATLPSIFFTRGFTAPTAVAIGPYHRFSCESEMEMGDAKRAAVEHLCQVASQPREAILGKMLSLAGAARGCYEGHKVAAIDDGDMASMMLVDGCFLLQFMASMCPGDPDADGAPEADPLMSRPEVHTRVDAIARDVMLLENQVPWLVLEALMTEFVGPGMPCRPVVDGFLALMASAFDVGGNPAPQADDQDGEPRPPPPAHLLDLFHRRQVGAARTQSLRVPRLSSLSCTAVELAEMGVKLVAGETKKFGDMVMSKRRRGPPLGLGLFFGGELSLAPLVLNELTMCWLLNLAAHEACLGPTRADNFAVSSYVSVVAMLVNRPEDVQELRGKGVVVSALSDEDTLRFFKDLAARLRVGHRYYHVFERVQEYRRERWLWIAVHRFLYKNIKTIVAVLSVVGVLAGLFKTILSLKQPQR